MDLKHAIALATDFDGTVALHGAVSDEALDAIARFRASGRKIALVTGRVLPDLMVVFPPLEHFDVVVAENGALLYDPKSGKETLLGERPPPAFVAALEALAIKPLSVGRVIVATLRDHEEATCAAMAKHAPHWQAIYNEESLMILPAGVHKGTGVRAAWRALGLSDDDARERTAAIGDAENDVTLLEACAVRAAVSDSPACLLKVATVVTRGAAGDGFVELLHAILDHRPAPLGG